MDKTAFIILTITELILKHGPDIALKMISAWNVENPTIEDWNALRVKDPSTYFDEL